MFKHLQTIIYICCLINVNFAEQIIESGDQTFVKHRDTQINLFKENVHESKQFIFNSTTFKIPNPDFVTNIQNSYVRSELQKYANPLMQQTNEFLMESFDRICSNDFNNNDRDKRALITLGIIGGAILVTGITSIFGIAMHVKNNARIEELQAKIIQQEEYIKKITNAYNEQTKQLVNERHLSRVKEEFEVHLRESKNIMINFIKLLTTGKAIKLSDIPSSIKMHLSQHGISDTSQSFYFLRLKTCNTESIVVEIKSAEATMKEQIKCNKFTNLGYFSNNFTYYHQIMLPGLYCHQKDDQCSQIDTKNCIKHGMAFNCTTTALLRCHCQINAVDQCKINTENVANDFLKYEVYDDFHTFATTQKIYSIIHPTNTVFQNVPRSGIFTTVINEADSLQIGGITIKGRASKPTFIESIIDKKYVAPAIPEVKEEKFSYNYTKLESHAHGFVSAIPFNVLCGIGLAFAVIFLIMVIFVSHLIHKKCCGNPSTATGAQYGKLELVVNPK